MGKYTMNSTLIATIPSPTVLGMKLTSVCGVAISGTTAYVLKSRGKSSDETFYPFAVCKITNFTKSPKVTTITVPKKICRHTNDITFGDKHLFITTMNRPVNCQLVKITTSGTVKKKYDYIRNGEQHSFSTCDFMCVENGKLKFIVGSGTTHDGKRIYDIAYIEGDKLVYAGITLYSQVIPDNYISNATYYNASSKRLYSTFFTRDSSGAIKTSYIFSYVLNDIRNGVQLAVANEFKVPAPFAYNKFEVEGVVVVGSTKYVACNCGSTNSKYNKDGFFKLKKKS